MQIIGKNEVSKTLVVTMTYNDWAYLQAACGVPHDKRSTAAGATASSDLVREAVTTLGNIKTFRKELGSTMKKWDVLAGKIDAVVSTEG